MEMFTAGDSASDSRKQTYERYRCHDAAKGVTRPPMSDTCAKLIASMSAIINDGALREWGGILILIFFFDVPLTTPCSPSPPISSFSSFSSVRLRPSGLDQLGVRHPWRPVPLQAQRDWSTV